jgi:hypothetical protein
MCYVCNYFSLAFQGEIKRHSFFKKLAIAELEAKPTTFSLECCGWNLKTTAFP